jgi:hypothetical protein
VQALGAQRVEHGEARIEALHAGELARVLVHQAARCENVDELEVVALASLVVVRIVRRRHLDGAGAKLHVHQHCVEHDRNLAVHERVLQHLAVQVLVARVVRMHRHGGVAEHRLDTRRRHHELVGVGEPTTL